MALTQLAFCRVGSIADGVALPVTNPTGVASEAITPSGSNQQSSAATRGFVRISTDTAIYVAFGSNPDATTATARFHMPANSVEWFTVGIGDKVAVVTA